MHPATAQAALRYEPPAGAAARTATSDGSVLDDTTSRPPLATLKAGETATVRGWFQAPADGVYLMAAWGAGGGTALFVGDAWLMGEPHAFINGNHLQGGRLSTEASGVGYSGHVSLRAGWHPFTIVVAKMPGNTAQGELHLRWTTPAAPKTWAYVPVRRAR